uniref:TonB-dependent receptor n=1 Tax=uncultured Helicobacter sp. TaxID=175537 RepID=A0A650ELA8_9HELI|nr:hypothetical protein Helico5904_0750 [uncultured Helicobacter sp.]
MKTPYYSFLFSFKNALFINAFMILPFFADSLPSQSQNVKLSPLITSDKAIEETSYLKVFDSQYLQNIQAQNLSETFVKDSEIQVGGGAKIAQKLYVRGLEDRMFRVRLDGIVQNGNIFHHQGNMLFDPFLVKSISIQKGFADIENGAGALAGGIDIVSKNTFDLLGKNQNYGAYFALGGQSNYGINTSLAAYARLAEKLGLLASYNFEDMPYYRAGNHQKVSSSESKAHNVLFKLDFQANAHHSMNLTYHFTNLGSIAPYSANVILDSAPTLYANTLNAHNLGLSYLYDIQDFSLKYNMYYTHKSLVMNPTSEINSPAAGGGGHDHNHEEAPLDLALQNLGADLIFKHSFASSRYFLKYGLNYQMILSNAYHLTDRQQDHGNTGKELGAVYGGFIAGEINLLDSLSLDIGSRYDVYSYRDKFSQQHTNNGFSPYISLLYTPINDLSLRISYDYATRGAMPIDVSLLTNSHATISSNLKAENMSNTQIDADFDNGFLSLRGSAYYSLLKNFINNYTNNGVDEHNSLSKNMEKPVEVLGYEVGAGLDFTYAKIEFSLAQSFLSYDKKPITDTFELGVNSGRSYNLTIHSSPFKSLPSLEILWISRFVEGIDFQGYNLYFNELENVSKKGYNTHNLYVNYQIKSRVILSLALLNLTNQTYTNQMSPLKELFAKESGIPLYEPGFNVKFKIIIKL